jgi:hypothetical protein
MYLADAARLLDITSAAVRKAVTAKQPSIRGLAPKTPLNATGQWLVSVADVEGDARRRNRPLPPTAGTAPGPVRTADGDALSTADLRVELIRADYVDALKAQLAEKDARIELLERLLAEKETRLGERDEQIASLRRRVRALADVD